ncbi:MAG: hypothetical protein LBL07_07675 [Tannerella sp.]|jgi:hypothetical protein|nr:hypothetical protein [Tannerella sp.]
MAQTISRKDSEFNEQQEVITSTTQKNVGVWAIDSTWFTGQVLVAKSAWVAAWTVYQDPAQRTPTITFSKNKARKTYEKLLRVLVQVLESNPRVTDDNRRAMGIVIRDTTRTPVKPPKSYPEFSVDSSIIRCLLILFWDLGSKSKAKPHGVHGAEIRWAILDHPPVSVEELIHSNFDTRSPFELMFDESDRGKTVYFCLRWENTRGEKGPWSEIVMAIIP